MAEVLSLRWYHFIHTTKRCFSFAKRNGQQRFVCIFRTCSSTTKRNPNDITKVFSQGMQQKRYSSTQTPNPTDSVHYVVQRLHEIEERMRIKGYSLLRWGLVAIIVMVTTLYFFREEVRENVADEVAVVATRSLGTLLVNSTAFQQKVCSLIRSSNYSFIY